MRKNPIRLLAAAVMVGAGALTTAGLAQADEPVSLPKDSCPSGMWCLYDGGMFDGRWIPAPQNGDLDRADWDTVSSGRNWSSKEVCLYSYDSEGVGQLVGHMVPRGGFFEPGSTGAEDNIDAVTTHEYDTSLDGLNGCQWTLPPVLNPDGAPPPWV